ncbi:MAG TPA: nicotinamide-nucleotide amidohydrolase family protein [Hyphomicrobium sp.]|jgi:nicotinamide-nucleotide amidase
MSSLFPPDLYDAAQSLLAELQRRALLIATAESCTGGLLAGLLTEVPGASAMVERGFVTYSDAAKTELLGVPADLIARYGAVSAEVGRAMAEGALKNTPAHVAVSITGIAGPDGGSPEKPVGLVYIAVAAKGERTRTHECRFGDIGRRDVRLASVRQALKLARGVVKPGLSHA